MLSGLQWEEEYCVGDPRMDADEKKLFGFINELMNLMMRKGSREEAGEVLVSLLPFVVDHMLHEEVLFYKSNYPNGQRHIESHEKYLRLIRNACARFSAEEMDSQILSAELVGILVDMVQEHVLTEDKEFGGFLSGRSSKVFPLVLRGN
jgi:hemerythrin